MAIMRVKMIFIHLKPDGSSSADATIDVPGLGEAKIEHSLTLETIERVKAEALAALKLKLGQTLLETAPDPSTPELIGKANG